MGDQSLKREGFWVLDYKGGNRGKRGQKGSGGARRKETKEPMLLEKQENTARGVTRKRKREGDYSGKPNFNVNSLQGTTSQKNGAKGGKPREVKQGGI